ncbi:MAG: hypothetical protein COU33_04925 [Candidatus Magasanikbacteria bacterium CG10_big_fil_rev_8_21_14_0_10_43_6]|uniref:Uncharacterized protein n=1 Tax=Candidatus Magasanikbacteria bacterium CG10_big_fil_rev_8_21_14_0_10_43_6 TaxID=1974650 RepID=A0A2M6VZZ3_9BACT|nr:MAG: hypothetical protein COU33_04925 [Candidatus Magasanikbacteria bacterium CG10_big_fil_rev_8_21_14_0_10_43_6]
MIATKSATGKKPPIKSGSSIHDPLQKELHDLRKSVDELHKDVRKLAPPHPVKHALILFSQGALKGLGFIFGTTFIAAVTVFLFQKILQTEQAQVWINDHITNVIEESITNTVGHIDPRNLIQ